VELGGKALVGPMAMEDHGLKFAVIQDPQGAVFGMVELTGKA
jgi:predicted enzyme related to lactoylglutathione lyase